MGKTFAEKILAKNSGRAEVNPGDFLMIRPDVLLTDEASARVSEIFQEIGAKELPCPDNIGIVLDHCSPACSQTQATSHDTVRKFLHSHKVGAFFDVGIGISHQLLAENGMIGPGKIVVGSDSHTITNSAFGAFCAGISRTEMAGLYATGEIWMMVPGSIRINFSGKLPDYASAKDVALCILGILGEAGATYKSVEYHNAGCFSMDERRILCNALAEAGAKSAFIAPDAVTDAWLKQYTGKVDYTAVLPDEDASYERVIDIDLSLVVPEVAVPHSPANAVPIEDLGEKIPVNQCFVGTCTGGRLSDIAAAARVMQGKHVAPFVRMIVGPVSKNVLEEAMELGYIKTLLDAGAVLIPPGCGPCAGVHQGVLAPGEVCVSSGIRNYKGRMGSVDAKIYVASAETVACSALTGFITDPRDVRKEG